MAEEKKVLTLDEFEQRLDQSLPTTRNELGTFRRDAHHQQQHDSGNDSNKNDAINGERRALEQNRIGKKIVDRRQFRTRFGRKHELRADL